MTPERLLLGPGPARIWRVGLMGAGSVIENVTRFVAALERVLRTLGHRTAQSGAAVAAVEASVR